MSTEQKLWIDIYMTAYQHTQDIENAARSADAALEAYRAAFIEAKP